MRNLETCKVKNLGNKTWSLALHSCQCSVNGVIQNVAMSEHAKGEWRWAVSKKVKGRK